jgi:Zn-dependent protease
MPNSIETLLLTLPIFLLSISFHEYSHAWAAYRLGDPTGKAMGRLTADPRAHIDPLGLVMFILAVLFGGYFIGWAKPVPVNHYNFRQRRRDMALVSISGPAANLLQAVAWYMLLRLFLLMFPFPLSVMLVVIKFLKLAVIVNIVLLCFNLLPIPPLDGSRVLAWLLPARQAGLLDKMEPFGFIILLGLLWTGLLGVLYRPLMYLVLWLFPGL